MSRRTIVDTKDCTLCKLSIIDTNAPRLTKDDLFAHGYIAGMHVVSKGPTAEEKFCADHDTFLNKVFNKYLEQGIKKRTL